jgi:CHAT domain-containing protein
LLALGNPAVAAPAAADAGGASRAPAAVPLPAAEREVQRVAAIYGKGRSLTMIGTAAREDRLKQEAPKHSILHIATHGVLDNASPLYSHLVLAPGARAGVAADDGRLSAREILGLTLQAELVVLSACETARGRVAAGEGIIGLTWALFIAGVPTTVVSQWRVDSDSTARLMVGFHGRLAAPGSTAAASASEALRGSALALLANPSYRHPFYWAGFVVVGDGLRPPATEKR